MTLAFTAAIAARGFDLRLHAQPGETIAVLGPNGAGKSTLVNILAGLLRPDTGRAELDGRSLFDLGAGRKHWTAPHARGVSTLSQDADLFPHLSVLENVAFSARSKGLRRAKAHALALHWLAEVDAVEFASRRPADLSGGQAQRVAIARALASDPHLLLLDEPLAALDIAVAPAIRRTLLRVLRDRTAIIVTHDILDALTLADRVIVLGRGRIIEEGPTRDTLDRPRTAFTAGLAALNLLTGTRTREGMVTDAGAPIFSSVPTDAPLGSRVAATIRPTAVRVALDQPEAPGPNRLTGGILDLEPRGDIIRVRSDTIAADLTPAAVADAQLMIGTAVRFTFDPAAVTIYSAERRDPPG
ncbi:MULTISPECIES: ABC transporter ATP-binding protein [unclassified Microbacterium]|uniref:sulfate/molybdate ABC transporter ATP-binding protein n=1 Tax=unclassified Microbacterium TaxID=2609290 RepID=UPI00214BA1C8|nr:MULTISPECIES: ABC transporter ATP-binding protein [unclassified Microbacterium]MCR2808711.1 ABC transporter ATP-binding protein [Microbacterium sp. zg.B185]WIM18858.1 ABC transporter ATP-binding protein [Microbacterium sp. zg-B185]